MRKRIAAAGIGLVALTVIALTATPLQSRQSVESPLQDLGMPADAEFGVIAMDSEGTFWDVTYFDSSGKEHVLIHRERPESTPRPAP